MSETDLKTIETALTTLSAEGYEATMRHIHPDFEMETLPGLAAEPQLYRGRDGLRRWWESFYEVMDEIELRIVELRDAGPGTVAAALDLLARGQTSGLGVSQRTFALVRVRDGMLVSFEFHESLDAALAAAA